MATKSSITAPGGLRTLNDVPADSKQFNLAGTPYTSIQQVFDELIPIGVRIDG